MTVAELCRKHGMSDASFYTWNARYGGLGGEQFQGRSPLTRWTG